jgi:thiol-disulfide isomerase/thioredoxin
LFLLGFPACAAPAQSAVSGELKALVERVQEKLNAGKTSEAELAPELEEFDQLFARHKGDKSEDAAQIYFAKAMLYLQVLDDTGKSIALLEQVKRDFPATKFGKAADDVMEHIQKQIIAKKAQADLVVGAKFPDFAEKDLAGQALSPAGFKGKVVLVDFWATWCGPCVRELPSVIKTYEAHHAQGFEVIGISLDEDEAKLKSFIKEKKMAWPQYFDGKGWGNKLAAKYGVQSIPATFLLDREGKIIGKDLRGAELDTAVANALARK